VVTGENGAAGGLYRRPPAPVQTAYLSGAIILPEGTARFLCTPLCQAPALYIGSLLGIGPGPNGLPRTILPRTPVNRAFGLRRMR
jgi:hypothetical protein